MESEGIRWSAGLLGIIAGATLLVGLGCDSVTVKDDSYTVEFAFDGSINSEFADVEPIFRGEARFSRSGISNRLEVSLDVVGSRGELEEQAGVTFRFAYASNSGELPPGHYSVVPDDMVPSIGEGEYISITNSTDSARYAFRGTSLSLDVEDSEPGRLVARFSFQLEQISGERLVGGQRISVELAGPVIVRGSFDLVIDGLEFVPES